MQLTSNSSTSLGTSRLQLSNKPPPFSARSDKASSGRLYQSSLWQLHIIFLSAVFAIGLVFFSHVNAQQLPDKHVELDDQTTTSGFTDNEIPEPQISTQHPEPDFDELSSGTFYMKQSNGFIDSPAVGSSVRMSISGIVASVELEQSFNNTGPEWVEGIYAFPLPDNAAINALTIQVGDRTIIGTIKEKNQAKKIYRAAKNEGRVASLVKQHRPNLFTTKIANIAPGEKIQITLKYIQTITPRSEQFSLRFPMTLTPRYSNPTVKDVAEISPPQLHADDASNNPDFDSRMQLKISLFGTEPASNLQSPSHQLLMQQYNDRVDIQLAEPTLMDQDFILEWTPATTDQPALATWKEMTEGEPYLLAMLLPPELDAGGTLPFSEKSKRELVLVIDTSATMAGESILAAKEALGVAIDGLQNGDRFNIIAFDSITQKLFTSSRPVNDETLEQARRFTRSLVADGGTEMDPALRAAFANPDPEFLRQVVFITDGSVGNEEELFTRIERQLRGSRLFTVGIGSAPNAWFMKKAAEAGRGTFTFIGDIAEAQSKMSDLFRTLEKPALTELAIEWFGGNADYTPSPLRDLYAGEPVIIAAKLDSGITGFQLTGKLASTDWQQTVQLNQTPTVTTGLSTVWARQKIESLLDQQRRSEDQEKYQSIITNIALNHKLVSPYTSFVAVDSTPKRAIGNPLASKQIPNLMPAGSTMEAISYPQGAAGSDTLLLLGFLSLVFMLMIKLGYSVPAFFAKDNDYADYR